MAPRAYPCPVRLILAWSAGAAVAALGAVVLGEYSFSGVAVLGAGALLGLFVAEAARAVAQQGSRVLAGGCALLAGGGMTWGGWIATGHDLSFLGPEGWAAVALGAAVAGVRARWTRPAGDNPPPAPAPAE
jgi:hypothetical protein